MSHLKVSSLKYSINGEKIIDDLSLDVYTGQLVIILGASGCGKSTLLNILGGYIKDYQGNIQYGKGLEKPSFVFQAINLISDFNVRDNISMPLLYKGIKRKKVDKKVDKVIEELNIKDLEKKDINNLSGGQKAKVGVARALVQNSSMILLDEPTGSLDEMSSVHIMELLKELSRTRLLIMVTHRETLALDYGDVVYKMENGRLTKLKDIKKKESDVINVDSDREKNIKDSLSMKWAFMLFKKKSIRSIIAIFFVSIILSLFAISLDISFNGVNKFVMAAKEVYNYRYVEISKVETIDNDKGISLIRKSAPKDSYIHHLAGFQKVTEYQSLDGVIGTSVRVFDNDNVNFINARFEPDLGSFKPLTYGYKPRRVEEVIVNYSLLEVLGIDVKEYGNVIINLSKEEYIDSYIDKETIKDRIEFDFDLKVVGVIEEKGSLNVPTIYYSYQYMWSFFSHLYLSNASIKLGSPYSVAQRIESSSSDDSIRNNKRIYVVEDPLDLKDKIEEDYQITSKALEIIENSKMLVNNYINIFNFFLAIVFCGAFLLQIMTLKTLYEEQKKKLAIVNSFHLKKKNYKKLFYSSASLFGFLISACCLIFEAILIPIANRILAKSSFPNLISSFITTPNIIVIFVAFIFSYMAAWFSWRTIKKENLIIALKEE